MGKKRFFESLREYHFEFKHLTVLFIVIFFFQLVVSFINKSSIKNFLSSTQEWYQKDSAERLANLTTTSMELLLETINLQEKIYGESKEKIIQSFDIILSQQILQHNIQEICILVNRGQNIYAIDEGKILFSFLTNDRSFIPETKISHRQAIELYDKLKEDIRSNEQIRSILTEKQTFHIFVPFVLRGEYIGAVYVKNTPDFSFITDQIISSYDETSVIYLSFILLGLLAMYFISSYTVKERDDTQKLLFDEHERNLKKQITYEKELVFTKRIYHTHHKAEKVMGFIKEDLRNLSADNIDDVKYRVTKYSNFISRVIYDMKWFDPPLQTIRNPIFNTNVNEVIRFIVDNIFLRITTKSNALEIKLNLDESLPNVPINEFVVWEIIEPLIQNGLDHGGVENLLINVSTKFEHHSNSAKIFISDNGKGILPELLERNEEGIKKIFLENVTSRHVDARNVGYGCYIAYEISKRCGWDIDAVNLDSGGCMFTINFSN
jgi:hypothetical protein